MNNSSCIILRVCESKQFTKGKVELNIGMYYIKNFHVYFIRKKVIIKIMGYLYNKLKGEYNEL